MNISQLQKLCDEGLAMSPFWEATVPKLVAVAHAAKAESLRWIESYCSRAECETMAEAWKALDEALAALESP